MRQYLLNQRQTMNRSYLGARGSRGLALAVFLFACGVDESPAGQLAIDLSVNNRGEQAIATVTLFQPTPVVLFSGSVGSAFSYDLSGVYQAFGIDEPGLDSGAVWTETGLYFASPSAPEGTQWPFYWFGLQGRHFSYFLLGEFTEAQAGLSPSGHVYVPLATPALPAPDGIRLDREFSGLNGETLGVSAYVHTRLADAGSTLLLLALAQPLFLVAARRRRAA